MFEYQAAANLTKKALRTGSGFESFFDVARILGKQKRPALGTFFALIVLVFIAYSLITPTFEASTLLVVGQNALDRSPEVLGDASETSTSMVPIVGSEEVIRQAVEKVGLTELIGPIDNLTFRTRPVIGQFLSVFTTASRRDITALDRAVPALSNALEVKHELHSRIIRISFRHKDPVTAAKFVDAVAQSFIDRQLILFGRPGAADFFQGQKVRFDEDIKRASEELQSFVTANRIYSISDERQLLLRRTSDSSGALATTRGSIADKVGQKETLTAQLRLLKPVTQSPFVSSLVTALGGEDRSEKNSSGVTPGTVLRPDDHRLSDSPPLLMVRVYQEAMVALFKVNGELTGLANLEQEQADEFQRLNGALGELSSREAEFAKLKRTLAQASLNSEIYARKVVEERISAESSAAKFSTVRIVQRAYAPLKPVSPNFQLFAGLGLVAGLAAAVAVALGLETLAPRALVTDAAPGTALVPLDDHELPPKRRRQLKKRRLAEFSEVESTAAPTTK
jgi:uncharacterized protein involved in exopolysaccharide biosynthesis